MRKPRYSPQYNAYGQKQCTQCKEYKDFSEYHKYKKSADGYKHFCKLCVKDYDFKEDEERRILPIKNQGTKIHCRRCNQYLDKDEFPKLRKNGKYLSYSYCIECDKLVGHHHNIKRYGLTIDDYVNLEKSQNGVCKICGEPEKHKKRLSIDHDHSCCFGPKSCGKCIRGLLCSNCNTVLGQVKDNKEILQKMINYLK
jgi:hypothetical protein